MLVRFVFKDSLVVLDSERLTRDHGACLTPGLPTSHLTTRRISWSLLHVLLRGDGGRTAQRTGRRRDLSVWGGDECLTVAVIDHVLEGCLAASRVISCRGATSRWHLSLIDTDSSSSSGLRTP